MATTIETSMTCQGTGVVPGLAYGPVAWPKARPSLAVTERRVPDGERQEQSQTFAAAVDVVAGRLSARAAAATGVAAEVLTATVGLARDRGWVRAAQAFIAAGDSAERATARATEQFVASFEKLGGLMAERVTDLKDVRDRVIAEILGLPEPGIPQPTSPVILFADDLAPADTAGLDPTLIVGLVTRLGGPTSHTAIIARQLGIPCIVATTGIDAIPDGTPVLIDGTSGAVYLGVTPTEAQSLMQAEAERREAIRAWRGPARTADGLHVELLANVQDGAGARKAAQSQAEGIGLFRTELCFLTAQTEPSVGEQAAIYGEVLAAFPGTKVVVRTLDAGSDKPVPFLNHPHEENPALGVRGIRIASGANEPVMVHQLDGIAAAAAANPGTTVWVMAPMVATVAEAKGFAAMVRERGLTAGIMVEVPASALLADAFIEHVDFMSIGTNDLTQYVMAADRMSPGLAVLTNSWQPAVLALIANTARAGKVGGKPVGVCGEAAADPLLACVLLGFGVTSLSMATAAIPAVGVQLSKVTLAQCQQAAERVLRASSPEEAKAIAIEVLGG